MKKTAFHFLIIGLLLISGKIFCQGNAPSFVSETLPPIPVQIAAQNQITASYIDGMIGTDKAMVLVFQNSGDKAKTFSCTVKNKQGKIIFNITNVVLNPGQSTGGLDDKLWMQKLCFVLPAGVTVSDLTTEITF